MEGLSSAGNIQGVLADALVSILNHHGVDKVLKWADDFCLFHIPTPHALADKGILSHHYSIDITSVFLITDPLGLPWHPVDVKGQDFASMVSYMGFLWDLQSQSMLLLTKKCLKYLVKIRSFQSAVK